MLNPLWLSVALSGPVLAQSSNWPDVSSQTDSVADGKRDAAIIIAIKDYDQLSDIPGAVANAQDILDYFIDDRGLKKRRTRLLLNEEATAEGMEADFAKMAKKVKKDGTLWVVFIGHAGTLPAGQGALLAWDARGIAKETSLTTNTIRQTLEGGRQQRAVVVLDTSFSGLDRSGQPLGDDLDLPLMAASLEPPPNVTVFTATDFGQGAAQLPGASRPAFSYLWLGGLRGWADADQDGEVSSAEISAYANDALTFISIDAPQTSTLATLAPKRALAFGKETGPDVRTLALSAFDARCQEGKLETCLSLGRWHQTEKEYAPAMGYFKQTCDGGLMEGCSEVGFMHEEAQGVYRDYDEAMSFYLKACEGEAMSGCYHIGALYAGGLGRKMDYARAIE